MSRATASALVLMLSGFGSVAPVTGGQVSTVRQVAVEGGGTYTEVGPTVLKAMLAREDVLVVNVHTPYAGEIDGTDRFIAFDAIAAGRAKPPIREDAKVILYCRSGPMSAIAARALVKSGYTNVSILAGGMAAWEDAGFTVTRRPR